ncbi:MAG: ABC transporter substrate-binding protein [Clostridia bacterium]|nr:ABC transporter substrate-binding protein [Clostridia bacterium]
MKKTLALIISLVIMLSALLTGCGYKYQELDLRANFDQSLKGTTLTVYNWGEYISDGADGSMDVNKEFEKLTGIKVKYLNYVSNETMYSQLKSGGVSYDIIIPSDYMIERLIKEDMLQKIDMSEISNYDLIDSKYKGLFFDEKEEYSVPYNVGMVGIVYNEELTGKDIEHSWKVLWDEKYKDMALNFDNSRDAFMTAQMILGQDVNSENKSDWDAAADLLKQGKKNLQDYVMDQVFSKMETGEASVAPYYAGDCLTMMDTNESLKFFYPEEGTNIFVDSVCIPKNAKNVKAALMYINFLLEPDVAVANAEYLGYASPNTAVVNNEDYCYYQNKILYPDEADMPKVQYYHDINSEIRTYFENLWSEVKLY